jgi:hypothetical protein
MLCYIHTPLHVTTTSGHAQAVKMHKVKITVDVAIVILIFMLFWRPEDGR